ncbi:hypothetical protein DFJ74DRAFT_763616 [Hyaloraphidium curvatum]|nr:hypothetical protein DFJ74DRAFT_763616 [Hyaloraphidium curvatum]
MARTAQQAFDELLPVLAAKFGPGGAQMAEQYRAYLTMGMPDDQLVGMFDAMINAYANVPETHMPAQEAEQEEEDEEVELADDSNESYNRGLRLMSGVEQDLRRSGKQIYYRSGGGFASYSASFKPLARTSTAIEKHYKHALELAPNHGRANIMLGMLYQLTGLDAMALKHLKPVVDPATGLPRGSADWIRAQVTLGQCCIGLNRLEEAARAFGAAVEEQPGDAERMWQLGIVLTHIPGRAGEAVAVLERADAIRGGADRRVAEALMDARRAVAAA